jgi:hypothetical protein
LSTLPPPTTVSTHQSPPTAHSLPPALQQSPGCHFRAPRPHPARFRPQGPFRPSTGRGVSLSTPTGFHHLHLALPSLNRHGGFVFDTPALHRLNLALPSLNRARVVVIHPHRPSTTSTSPSHPSTGCGGSLSTPTAP